FVVCLACFSIFPTTSMPCDALSVGPAPCITAAYQGMVASSRFRLDAQLDRIRWRCAQRISCSLQHQRHVRTHVLLPFAHVLHCWRTGVDPSLELVESRIGGCFCRYCISH